MSDSYEGVAKFYDLFGKKEDVGFLTDLARRCGGTCLQLGVGIAVRTDMRSFSFNHTFDRENLLVEECCVSSVVNTVSRETMGDVLQRSGFEVEQEFGDFKSTRYMLGDEWLVIVAKRRV